MTNATDTSTQLINSFTGRWARGINNAFVDDFMQSGLTPLPYPYQNTLTGALRAQAKKNNLIDSTSLWAGQSAGKAQRKSTKDMLDELISSLKRDNVPGFR